MSSPDRHREINRPLNVNDEGAWEYNLLSAFALI